MSLLDKFEDVTFFTLFVRDHELEEDVEDYFLPIPNGYALKPCTPCPEFMAHRTIEEIQYDNAVPFTNNMSCFINLTDYEKALDRVWQSIASQEYLTCRE